MNRWDQKVEGSFDAPQQMVPDVEGSFDIPTNEA